MNAKLVSTLAVCSLALGGFGAGLAGWANADNILGRYPGSTRLESKVIDLNAVTHGALERQAVYDTTDNPGTARRWYAARLHQSWSSEVYTDRNCAWLTGVQQIIYLRRELSVSVCNEPHGTRVVVTESLTLGP
jgi:hypothetical protein